MGKLDKLYFYHQKDKQKDVFFRNFLFYKKKVNFLQRASISSKKGLQGESKRMASPKVLEQERILISSTLFKRLQPNQLFCNLVLTRIGLLCVNIFHKVCYYSNKTKGTLVHEREQLTLPGLGTLGLGTLGLGTLGLGTPGLGTPVWIPSKYPRSG